MRQQLITDDSFSEAEARRRMRGLRSWQGPRAGGEAGSGPMRHTVIARTVEDQVIPRLLHAQLALRVPAVSPEDIASLTSILLSGTQAEAEAFLDRMRGAGLSHDSLCLDLFAPAARRLGALWVTDDCNFADVTIGTGRLAKLMRLIGGPADIEAGNVPGSPRALLIRAPGEQHGFGIAMVARFFRKAGWTVVSEPVSDSASLIDLVRREWFGVVGLSLACGDRLDNLADDIRAIRAASRNPAIGIMAGGFAFSENPHLAIEAGADCTASDARLAVRQANALVAQRARAT